MTCSKLISAKAKLDLWVAAVGAAPQIRYFLSLCDIFLWKLGRLQTSPYNWFSFCLTLAVCLAVTSQSDFKPPIPWKLYSAAWLSRVLKVTEGNSLFGLFIACAPTLMEPSEGAYVFVVWIWNERQQRGMPTREQPVLSADLFERRVCT